MMLDTKYPKTRNRPGAWEKNGLTYRLADQPKSTDADSISAEVARQLNERTERMQQLQKLGLALQQFSIVEGGLAFHNMTLLLAPL